MDQKTELKLDRRIKKTKKALKDGLAKLMLIKSIKDITVKELTEAVDINRGTFYLHYRDIFDMTEQIESEMLNEFIQVITSHNPHKSNSQPLPLLIDIFIFIRENSSMCTALLSSNGDIAFVNKFKEAVRENIMNHWTDLFKIGNIKVFDYFYSYILAGYFGLIEKWLSDGLIETPEQMAKLTEETILHGIKVLSLNL